MKVSFKFIFTITALLLVASCGPKGVQPIHSLSAVDVGEINITNIEVSLSPEFVDGVQSRVTKERESIIAQRERIAGLGKQTRLKQKQITKVAEKSIEKSERKIISLETEMAEVETDVREGIVSALANKFVGRKNVDVSVSVNSFAMTNGGAVVLLGGSDSMTGLLRIQDSQSDELLGEYYITDLDTNAAGGLLGLMVRGGDPRGDMIKQFSQKVFEAISGKYDE